MAMKKSVYLQSEDLERLRALRKNLKAEFPMHKVTSSWVFRYALYRLFVARGLAVGPQSAPVEEEGP